MEAAIRPNDWELPLLVHVAGAMVLVGALLTALILQAAALRRADGRTELSRLGFRVLLLGAIPAYVVMRVAAQWVASQEDIGDPGWVGLGYATAEGGLVLTVIATVIAWRAARREPPAVSRAVPVILGVVLVALTVTIWAMTVKPD